MKWWGDLAARVLEDVLVFLAAVIGHVLSWPVVTLVIVLILLKPIRRLIGRMRTAKVWGSEAEFVAEELVAVTQAAVEDTTEAAEAAEAAEAVESSEPETEARGSDGRKPAAAEKFELDGSVKRWISRPARTGRYSSGARASLYRHLYDGLDTADTVLEAWVGFSPQLRRLHEHFIGPVPANLTNYELVDALARVPDVARSFVDAVRTLLFIRGRVLNSDMSVSNEMAVAYVNSAHRMNDLAESMLTSSPNPDPDAATSGP